MSGGIILGSTAHGGTHALAWAVMRKSLGHKIPYGTIRPKNFCIRGPMGGLDEHPLQGRWEGYVETFAFHQ